MKIVNKINLILLTLLGLTSGVAKLMQLPDEVKFFLAAGFSLNLLLLLGASQLVGGVLLLFRNLRIPGALALAITFLVSTIAIFASGNVAFGVFSVVPIVMAFFVIIETRNAVMRRVREGGAG